MSCQITRVTKEISSIIQSFSCQNLRSYFNRNFLALYNRYHVKLNKDLKTKNEFCSELNDYKEMLKRQTTISNMYYTGMFNTTK
ncbi:hypothetical protein cmbei_5002473 [Cryptosporidium meleagridis]